MDNIRLIIYLAAAWLLITSLRRAWKARSRAAAALDFTGRLRALPRPFLNLLAAICIAWSLFLGASLFFQDRMLTAILVLASIIPLTSALDVIIIWRHPNSLGRWHAEWAAPIASVLLAAGLLSLTLSVRHIPGAGLKPLAADYPVKGSWRVITGGGFGAINYHYENPHAQNYALDLVRDQGDSEGESIYAPIGGRVTTAITDRTPGSREPEGNLVIIQDPDGTELWLAHLRRHSVLVKKGDRVFRGQPVAACGATGSADVAHLHIHAQRGNDPVPLVFGPAKRFLVRNDRLRND